MTPFHVFFALFCVFTVNIRKCISQKRPECEKYIDYINQHQNTWTAGKMFNTNIQLPDMNTLMGLWNETEPLRIRLRHPHRPEVIANLPENFDARNKWSNCPSLNDIRDQGHCGSCWAFGAVSAMTDRVCIYSNGTKNFHFSAEDVVTCANCDNGGCNGCGMEEAWIYWGDHGIVSGGGYHSEHGCRPYTIPTTFQKGACGIQTPPCVTACREGYKVPYEKDKQFGKHVYILLSEDQMKAEIYQNGPVEAGFSVYEDFMCYKNGIYRHIAGPSTNKGHAVKILGWGVEKGTKYWLAANSWTPYWGYKGFFKFVRGENHCGIENYMIAGEPLL